MVYTRGYDWHAVSDEVRCEIKVYDDRSRFDFRFRTADFMSSRLTKLHEHLPLTRSFTAMSFRVRKACANSFLSSHVPLNPAIGSPARQYATNNEQQKEVAILGGGITGLAAAFGLLQFSKLSRTTPKITIYESKSILGGWISSEFVDVPGGKVLLEKAVRTLRPAGPSGLLGLLTIHKLGLEEELLTCPKDSPAAKNRYVYYPDHLVRMPSSLADIPGFLQEPLAKGLVGGLLKDLLISENLSQWKHLPGKSPSWADKDLTTTPFIDQSVGRILARRFDPGVADLASAVFHGIYAGDVDELSLAMVLPRLRHYLLEYKSITRGALRSLLQSAARDEVLMPGDDAAWYELIAQMWAADSRRLSTMGRMHERIVALQIAQHSSVYSFKRGIQQLSDRLSEVLRKSSRVEIITDCAVSSVQVNTSGSAPRYTIESSKEVGRQFTHVISTVPGQKLNTLLGYNKPSNELDKQGRVIKEALTWNNSVSVMVVNLWYPRTDLLPVEGFGYLIPRHIPLEQNPELGLGVVFDSDAIQGQDTVPGTKLTVMLGGHHWKGFTMDQLPSESEGIANARSLIARHLGITDEPGIARATMNWDCIPQYQQYHADNMSALKHYLQSDAFGGRLIPAGSSFEGVGVNDCIRSGWTAASCVFTDKKTVMAGLNKVTSAAQKWQWTARSLRGFKFE